ncbi:MAG: sigma-70 family RNA polymerase sigma factor [Anaerolineaceae bacterium]
MSNKKRSERFVVLTAIFEENETVIVTRAKSGDIHAFEELILQYRGRVTDLIYHMYGDENLAEDAAQVAFIQVWRNLSKFEHRAPFRSWLYRIALNAARDQLRRQKPQVDIDAVLDLSLEGRLEEKLEEKERRSDVQQAVAELPDASRSVLILKEFQGLRYQEIAEVLDIPLGTVMSRLNYARKIMTGKLSKYLEDV